MLRDINCVKLAVVEQGTVTELLKSRCAFNS